MCIIFSNLLINSLGCDAYILDSKFLRDKIRTEREKSNGFYTVLNGYLVTEPCKGLFIYWPLNASLVSKHFIIEKKGSILILPLQNCNRAVILYYKNVKRAWLENLHYLY